MKKGRANWHGPFHHEDAYIDNPVRTMINRARHRAKLKNIPFDIEPHDLVIPDVCPYLKTPFTRKTMYAMSLDQKIPGKGYTKDNVEIISRKANTMKTNASVEELLEFAYEILERH